MNAKVYRTTVLAMIAIAVIAPLAVMLLVDFNTGLIFLLFGLLYSVYTIVNGKLLRSIDAEGERDDRHAAARQNRGSTIYVPLLDDAGNPLDPAAAERLLARARLMAGPRETVVGVERTPAEARKL
ncbi:MAG TPA: hypothetical protein VGE07_30185 [Herpetosiphonaceae bacterium]